MDLKNKKNIKPEVRRVLHKVKPRVATLEQTFGLATHKKHKRNFRMLCLWVAGLVTMSANEFRIITAFAS